MIIPHRMLSPEALRGVIEAWLMLDSRVVMDQFRHNRLVVKAFVGGLDQCGILGGSCCISSVSVSYGVCKPPESNMSLQVLLVELNALSGGFLLWWCHEMTLLPSFPFANTFLVTNGASFLHTI
jgi:hypothetical protein